ncbi:unnamed protein product [Blepharisma stoltei]|uniref:TmcB/TmcC TPR repeats domain-containing protein n=1 Tax=Blepharisma stoltei TaxID=1481888 RepID=A0AAU9ICT5_9CILI|nr:unnamed protein product [Blepharisma stoltei]
MGVPEAEIGEHEELNKSLWRTNAEITLKNSIFEFFYQLYHTKNIDELSILSQKVKETFIAIIWCLQIMSLLWIPNLPISNWSKNMTMWEIIGYLRLDNICSEFEIITEFFFLTIIMAFIIFLCITAMTLLYYNSHNIPKFILTIFKSVFDIWAIAFLIPSITLFSAFLKYNLLSQDISAYESNNDQDEFKLSSISQLIIIFIMILIFPLIIVNQEFSGLIRHSISSRVLKAKAHSKIDVHIAIFTYFSPILYVCTGKDYMVYFQLFMMIISLILIWEIANFSPYFSFYYGLLKILELFAIALISFGFILGHLMDNSLVIIFIAVILGPFSALFVIQFTLNLQSKFNVDIPENLLEIYSKYELEKSLRHSLCSNDFEHKDQIINIFETFFNDTGFDRDKLQLVWVANYCLFTLKDESLAKIKLSRTKYISKWNLEADFQIYCTNKVIQGSVTSENEQYIIYLQQFHLIKNKDLKLCVNLLKFWDELTSSRPDLNRLKKRLALINKNIVFIAEKYSQLSTKFCNSREALSLYTSFMRDVLFDNEKSRFLENKLRFLSISIGNSGLNPFSFFDDTNSILIVSAEKESFGRILFTNAQAKNIMKLTSLNFDRGNIMNFIHSYYWRQLKEFAIRYSHFCSNSEINLKEGFFLNLPSEFLIGCIGKVSVTAIGNFIVFVLVFKQSPKNYQIALLSENGEILCHTKDFAERAGKKPDNLVGCNIKHLFPNIEQYSINNDFAKSESSLYYSIAYFQNLKIYYALLISDYNEIQTSKNEDIKYTLDIKGKKDIKSHSSLNLLEWFDKEFKKESQIELSYNSEMHLNSQNFNKIPGKFEMNYIENFEEEKSEVLRNNRFTKLVLSSSKKINMLHFAFILSVNVI